MFAVLEDLTSHSLTVTALAHPSTYLNKILFGSSQGKLQLWNLRSRSVDCWALTSITRSRQMIFEFKGWGSAVTSLCQSPAVDVMAIGLAVRKLSIHLRTWMRFALLN